MKFKFTICQSIIETVLCEFECLMNYRELLCCTQCKTTQWAGTHGHSKSRLFPLQHDETKVWIKAESKLFIRAKCFVKSISQRSKQNDLYVLCLVLLVVKLLPAFASKMRWIETVSSSVHKFLSGEHELKCHKWSEACWIVEKKILRSGCWLSPVSLNKLVIWLVSFCLESLVFDRLKLSKFTSSRLTGLVPSDMQIESFIDCMREADNFAGDKSCLGLNPPKVAHHSHHWKTQWFTKYRCNAGRVWNG